MKNVYSNNDIHPTAKIGRNVILGQFNKIGQNVVMDGFKEDGGRIIIGDCNSIYDNTRILAGEGGISIGDWNVFHNNMLVMGEKEMRIGHNCWFGQNTILDATGGLEIGHGVRVGMYSQIWTHVASGELIEGCTLFGKRKTIIEDNVWLVGSCIVSSGIVIRERGIFLIGSNITKNTEAGLVYAGSPARTMEKLHFYRHITLEEKFTMMLNWVDEFVKLNPHTKYSQNGDVIELSTVDNSEKILVTTEGLTVTDMNISIFNLKTKTYTKKLSSLEIAFYRFLFGHKARFLPE